jgi:hypothetical protein
MADRRLTTRYIDGTKNSGMETINCKVVPESFSRQVNKKTVSERIIK